MSLSDRVRPDVEAAPWVIEEIRELEDRVKELEDMFKSTDEDIAYRNDEIAKFRKVVEAARKHKENASHNNYVAMCNALIELDGQSK